MEKSVFTPHYDVLRKAVVRLRAAAGLTQRQLARRLGCPQNTVLRIEQGERRIDLVEFWRICRACGASFDREVLEFARAWKRLDSPSREGPRSRAKGKGKGESLPLGKGRRCREERGALACERPS